jgi:hypothetical protein
MQLKIADLPSMGNVIGPDWTRAKFAAEDFWNYRRKSCVNGIRLEARTATAGEDWPGRPIRPGPHPSEVGALPMSGASGILRVDRQVVGGCICGVPGLLAQGDAERYSGGLYGVEI